MYEFGNNITHNATQRNDFAVYIIRGQFIFGILFIVWIHIGIDT
jgi:hypothetical protein